MNLKLAFLSAVLAGGCGSGPGMQMMMPVTVNLDPPPVGQGFQFKTGDFSVAAGTETQRCFFFEVPGNAGEDVWVTRTTMAQNEGSHHMNLFRVSATPSALKGVPGDVVVDGPCFGPSSNWADWPMVNNSQSSTPKNNTIDWKLPDGVGIKFKAGELLMLQSHYVNASSQKTPAGARGFVNFWTQSAAPAQEMGTLFATNQNIRICPGDSGKTFESHCTWPSKGATIIGANGHMHSRGADFNIFTVDAQGNTSAPFYDSKMWDDPPMMINLNIPLDAGSGIGYKCTFDYVCPNGAATCGNPADSDCITFGGHVETQEHCNSFVYYYPKTVDIGCY